MDIETAQVLRTLFARVDQLAEHASQPETKATAEYEGARTRTLAVAAGGSQPTPRIDPPIKAPIQPPVVVNEPSSEPQVGTTGTGDAQGTVTTGETDGHDIKGN